MYKLLRTSFLQIISAVSYHSKFITEVRNLSKITKKLNMDIIKCRENPVVTVLDTPEFKSMFTPELESLVNLFKKHNYEIRIAGGAVRDLLMGKKPTDIDFATTATPDQMKQMFESENVRMINTKGEKHGTITPRINDKENFEVTTLRIDVVTDGRHAEVEFTTDWMLDSNRRDLTINSMFLGLDGSVYDYFYGYDDIKVKRIAFVGDADTRIKEDYLRILRYFRFYGRIADKPDAHEENTLRIISQNVSGLEKISGERIWSELKKILQCNFAGELFSTMHHVGVTKYCGLPEQPDMTEFVHVWARSKHLNLQPVTLLAGMLRTSDQTIPLNERLKMSAYDRDLIVFVVEHREEKPDVKPLKPYQKLVINSKRKSSEAKDWVLEILKYQNSSILKQFQEWDIPKFPVTGNMLREHGVKGGKYMGIIMKELREFWFEHDFKPTAEEILKQIPIIQNKLEELKLDKL